MADRIQAVRGMNDLLPADCIFFNYIEQAFEQALVAYGYKEIRFPLIESTQLFKRTIGEITDIVEKEMYSFTDLNGDSLTLRPEGTAGCVRACLEHGLLHNQQQKLWYAGPMFRHEKPQKGRYRQFHQLGVEAFGFAGVSIELEQLLLCRRLWEKLGIAHKVSLEINTIGDLAERDAYREALIDYFKPLVHHLDEDSVKRLERNPLRILDSKIPETKALVANAPTFIGSLGEASRQHFTTLCDGLDALGIAYTVNPFLVRGLDYYSHTVFEWVTDSLGSQATVCAGGRYDQLVAHLGGQATPAVGFAMGIERLRLLVEHFSTRIIPQTSPTIYVIAVNQTAVVRGLELAEKLRDQHSDWSIMVDTSHSSFKSQFKKADKSGARFALILGEDEIQQNSVSVKDLRELGDQKTIPQDEVHAFITRYLEL